MISLKQQILSSVKWNMIGTVAVQGTTMLSGIVVARLLQPADYGLVALASAAVTVFSVLAKSGFAQALIAQSEVDAKVSDSVISLLLIVGLVAVAILQLLARPLAGFYLLPTLEPAVRVASIGLLLSMLVSVPRALLQKQLDFNAINQVTIVSALIGASVAVGLSVSGFGFWALILPAILSALVKVVGFFAALRYWPRLRLDWRHVQTMARFGTTVWFINLGQFVVDRGIFFILGRLWPPATVGLFQFARARARQPFDLLVTQYSTILFPALTRVRDDRLLLKRAFLYVTRISIVIVLPLYVLVIALAPQLIPLVFGSHWMGTIPAFQIAATFLFVGAFGTAVTSVMYAMKKPKVVLYTSLLGVMDILIIVGLLLLFGRLEIVMSGVTMSMILRNGAYYLYCYRWLGVTWREFADVAGAPVLSAAGMIFCLLVVRYSAIAIGMHEVGILALATLAAGGLYLYLMRADIGRITQMLLRQAVSASGRA